jgi:hypothetical protein
MKRSERHGEGGREYSFVVTYTTGNRNRGRGGFKQDMNYIAENKGQEDHREEVTRAEMKDNYVS